MASGVNKRRKRESRRECERAFENSPAAPMPDWIAQRESHYWSGFAFALAFGCLSLVLFQTTTSGTSDEKFAKAKEPMDSFAFTPQERTPPAPLWPTIELASARSDDPFVLHSRDPAVEQKNEQESPASSAGMVADAQASRFVALPPVTVPRGFLGASVPLMGNCGINNLPLRSLGNGMYESIPNWQTISTVSLIPMTMSNRPTFVENGIPIHGPGEQLLPTETRVRSKFADSSSWSSEPTSFREPIYPYPDHLNGEQQADLDLVIRLLVRQDLSESAKSPDKLLARGREITDREPRLFYAMGLNSLRHHRFDEALDYIKQSKRRTNNGYFAPWRDYIRLLAMDRRMEEVAGELEEFSRAVSKNWQEVHYSSAVGVDASKLNSLFLGRVTGYVQCTVGSAERPPTLFLGREKLIENELPPALLPIFRTGKTKVEAEIAEQRRRDDERLAAIQSRWREMIKTGQKGTTNVDNTTISSSRRENLVHMQGNLGPGLSAGYGISTGEEPSTSYSKYRTYRQRYAETIERMHRTEFEKAKFFSPYLRAEQISYYEPVSAHLSARDLIATLPTISSEYLSQVEPNRSTTIAEIE